GNKRPRTPADSRHVYHDYARQSTERDNVQNAMTKAGNGTGIHYPIPVQLQPAYASLGYRHGDLPVTEALDAQFLSLPIYAELGHDSVERVAAALDEAVIGAAGRLPSWTNDG